MLGRVRFKCTLPISPFAISPHYNTSCKLVICASLFFYKETPGYEAVNSTIHNVYIASILLIFHCLKIVTAKGRDISGIKVENVDSDSLETGTCKQTINTTTTTFQLSVGVQSFDLRELSGRTQDTNCFWIAMHISLNHINPNKIISISLDL
jgi:hypothetical protein